MIRVRSRNPMECLARSALLYFDRGGNGRSRRSVSMIATVTVREGECLSSIAFEHGHFWSVLWDHPDNAALREKRGNPHVLQPGDRVVVPDLRQKEAPAATDQTHTFRRKGVPEKLRIRFGTVEHPRAGIPYTLTIDGTVQ